MNERSRRANVQWTFERVNHLVDGRPAIAKNFNEVQDKVCPLQPIKMQPNKSIVMKGTNLGEFEELVLNGIFIKIKIEQKLPKN